MWGVFYTDCICFSFSFAKASSLARLLNLCRFQQKGISIKGKSGNWGLFSYAVVIVVRRLQQMLRTLEF
jgi:hypothetical protein